MIQEMVTDDRFVKIHLEHQPGALGSSRVERLERGPRLGIEIASNQVGEDLWKS
jgi:hypothetical protein